MFIYPGLRFLVHVVCGSPWDGYSDEKYTYRAYRHAWSDRIMISGEDTSLLDVLCSMEDEGFAVKSVTTSHSKY